MECATFLDSTTQDSPDELPPLFQHMVLNALSGFDNDRDSANLNYQGTDVATFNSQYNFLTACLHKSAVVKVDSHQLPPVSVSMPSSPVCHLEQSSRVLLSKGRQDVGHVNPAANAANIDQLKQAQFHSLPFAGIAYADAIGEGASPDTLGKPPRNLRSDRLKDKAFDSFKTWSGKLERQISILRGKSQEAEPNDHLQPFEANALPVDCYFDALKGPELDTLRGRMQDFFCKATCTQRQHS